MLRITLCTLGVAVMVGNCAISPRQQSFRFVDCTDQGRCPIARGTRPSSWLAEHESLYWKAVRSIAKKEACAGDALTDKIAYQSERRLAVSCDGRNAAIPWLEGGVEIGKAFASKGVEHASIFKKCRALKTDGGIGVELTEDNYARPNKANEPPIPEGEDFFVVLEIDEVVEIQLLSRLSL